MPSISKVHNNPIREQSATGFQSGLNTFQDETILKDSELTKAKNIMLTVDGIEPRPGILHYGGNNSEAQVLGGFAYYKSNGSRYFLRMSGGKLTYKNGLNWTIITGKTYNTSARMNFLQARDKVFMFNGVDTLSYTDGATITTYTALTTPTGVAVITVGTAGTTSYSYRISAFNDNGETLASNTVTIATGNANLDATNYTRTSWTAVTGATGYNIFGRKNSGLRETYLTTVYTNLFEDKGEFDPSTVILPPDANTSTGIICQKAVFAQSRIFAAGDPTYPSRLYYGGVGSNIGNFSFSETGGGATDIFKDDGSIIRDILPFQGGVIIWKDNAIYKFSFNSAGQPTLEEITRSFGGIAWRGSKHVENDVMFTARKDGRLAFYSLGNQENYSAGIIRTNELSIRISSKLKEVNTALITNACSFYFNSIYGCAIPTSSSATNDRIWCLDTRFGSWVYWEGMDPNFFTDYTDVDGTQKLYYGSENTGYIEEMFVEDRNDNGEPISVEFATKSFNQKQFQKYKKFYNPIFQFKDVSRTGSISGDIIVDGATTAATFSVNAQTTGGAGFGVTRIGLDLFGDSPGGVVTSGVSSDTIIEIKFKKIARSLKYEFRSNSVNSRFKFLSFVHSFMVLDNKRLPSSNRFYST